jgi:thiosulfate/3-mercaptopyruvate sulfurtransferase
MSRDHPLISVEELAGRSGDPTVRIVDVRWYLGKPGAGRAAYDAAHIPGARHFDLDADLSAPAGPGRHPLPDPTWLAAHLGSMGIGDGHLVVGYDDAGGATASRLWWMLDDLGHDAVVILDGGLAAWTADGHALSTEVPAWPPAALTLGDQWTRTIDRDEVRARLGDVRLLDGRAAKRYRGEVEPVDLIPGHIPTAINAPTDANLGPDGRFLGPDELAGRFAALGAADAGVEVVTSCGSGVTACHNSLAMRLAGLPDPMLYAGSYSDWTRSGLPIATGENPGDPI